MWYRSSPDTVDTAAVDNESDFSCAVKPVEISIDALNKVRHLNIFCFLIVIYILITWILSGSSLVHL